MASYCEHSKKREFERFLVNEPEIYTAKALGIVRDMSKRQDETIKSFPKGKKYRVVYADYPWKYGGNFHRGVGGIAPFTTIETHFPTMSLDDICALPVKELSAKNSVLFLWATSALLEEALQVIKAWGFSYKTSMIWDKVKHEIGYYISVRHELLLIAGKGLSTPDVKKLYDSVYVEERTTHSKKPEYFRNLIDELYLNGIELNSLREGNFRMDGMAGGMN